MRSAVRTLLVTTVAIGCLTACAPGSPDERTGSAEPTAAASIAPVVPPTSVPVSGGALDGPVAVSLPAPVSTPVFLTPTFTPTPGPTPGPTPEPGTTPVAPPTVLPPPVRAGLATDLETPAETARFLMQAGFGGSPQDIGALTGFNAATWVAQQLNAPAGPGYRTRLRAKFPDTNKPGRQTSRLFWASLSDEEDVLRQRMVFALSQIVVASEEGMFGQAFGMAHYLDILEAHAFGYYRDLLEDMTYAPVMARYLSFLRNRKADPDAGSEPDENYAREILQLFSIGLVELNPDGTPRLGSDGRPIETYDNEDVVGLARVFTGLAPEGERFWSQDDSAYWNRMRVFDEHHSMREKRFLGTVIPANTPGETSVQRALETIFAHPNVAPFLARQLIQRFTASSPSPAYVERVSRTFDAGRYTSEDGTTIGTGERGDLAATLAAVLLDRSVHAPAGGRAEGDAKIREPVLRHLHLLRAFDATPLGDLVDERMLYDTRDPGDRLGQHPARAESVFNFYRPGYIAPGTESGAAGLTTPELQIVNEASAIGWLNWATEFAVARTAAGADSPLRPGLHRRAAARRRARASAHAPSTCC